ncbi:hypothetical protein CASFOL_034958 [Castilleja foliolosa]|uniref:Leucine-rich repeat-containing N-terminal plant-type domain-containing protein n=1 Tax=Castilleja foliolosa TaxID=1961234 RepID=A0ABD3BRB2_9LAMI
MEMWLLLVCLILLHHLFTSVSANDGEILLAISDSIEGHDPMGYLAQWKISGDDHCKWPYVTCIFNTTQVGELSLSMSMLSGPITGLLGNLSSLEYLDLSSNNFSGPIPDELGHLSNLKYLYLDHNNLTGAIPKKLTKISCPLVMDLSNNGLWGKIPRDGCFDHFGAASFENNTGLCGVPLGKCGR